MKTLRILKSVVYFACFFCGLVFCHGFYQKTIKMLEPQIIYMDREVEVPARKKELSEIIREAAEKSNIPAVLITAIIEQESGGDQLAVRFEPHHLSRIPASIKDPIKRKGYASSIGLMQPMGWHLLRMAPHLNYTALFDPEINVAVGTRVLSDCLKRHVDQPPSRKYRLALTCYNGSEIYAEEVLERVGVLALAS